VIHPSFHCQLLEGSAGVGRAAADVGDLVIIDLRVVSEHLHDLCGHCRSVHLRHTVVEEDQPEHLSLSLEDVFYALLNKVESLAATGR